MTAKVTVAPNAAAEATLALARRFLHAVNTRNADGSDRDDGRGRCLRAARGARRPLSAGTQRSDRRSPRWRPRGRTTTSTVNTIFADATLFVAEWTMTGTLGQPLPVGSRIAVPDGRRISFDGVDICPVANGKVTAKSSYIDATAWYEQLTFQKD